jgi:hypothetical protein
MFVCPKASAARISAFVWQETGPRETLQMCRPLTEKAALNRRLSRLFWSIVYVLGALGLVWLLVLFFAFAWY